MGEMNVFSAAESFRLFIALGVPEAVKAEMERTQAELRRAVRGHGVRWAGRNQFHLTLRFLGDVETARVGNLVEALRTAATSFAPLQMRAKGVGFFPNARYPRVVWVGVQDAAEQLGALQRAVHTATAAFTEDREEARFTGHVTLGRIKSLKRPETEALARAAALAEGVLGDWVAAEVELMRSQLSPQGSVYTRLARLPFQQHFT